MQRHRRDTQQRPVDLADVQDPDGRGSDSTKNASPAQDALLVVWNTTSGTMNSRI
jgi:hypothetical protein